MKLFKKIICIIAVVFAVVVILLGMAAGCQKQNTTIEPLPELLCNETFVYDELAAGEGTALYTLRFSEHGYKLYQDNGVGIVAHGDVIANPDKSLVFTGTADMTGSYVGSAFEEASVSLTYQGTEMTFTLATDTTEYAYLAYLGIYEAEISEKPAIMILDRWFEFYIYTDETLLRGNYEIYQDGKVELITTEGDVIAGSVVNSQPFDTTQASFAFDIKTKNLTADNVSFSCAKPADSYEAAHAMGAYTLSLYGEDVFTIHGVDGLLKAMGTIQKDRASGSVTYFPRQITNDMELDERFTYEFTCQEDILLFPDSTYLLPRSGNINEETGYGSYWSSGTALEFVKKASETSADDYQAILTAIASEEKLKHPTSKIPDSGTLLNQSMPSVGTAKPLVLLIDFPDYHRPRFVTAKGIEEALFDIQKQDSLSGFYYVSSYGNLTIDGTVLDWYRTSKNRDEYDSDKEIMAEAINYYIENEGLSLADYDADNDGEVDSLYVLWAGNMDQTSHNWSGAYRSTWKNCPEEWECDVRGYIFVPGITVWSSVPPLTCNLNSLTHETGHLLGLNDYYSYDTTDRTDDTEAYTGGALEGGIGGMDMMDANIGDHNAFSKWLLGWIEPEVVEYQDIKYLKEESATYTLSPSNEAGNAIFVKLKDEDSLYTELLVIEVVSASRNTDELTRVKDPVVRILHVDASLEKEALIGNWRSYGFKQDNSYTSTKFISLLEADGNDTSINYLPAANGSKISYDIADYFAAGDEITPSTYPNTNGYDVYGNATAYTGLTIKVESISADGKAVIQLGYEEKTEALEVVDITPDPTIVPYVEGSKTTISADTKEVVLTFNEEITWVNDKKAQSILFLSGNQKLTQGTAKIEGNKLILSWNQELAENKDYTVVIPANVVCSTKDETKTNAFNSIYGFVTK